MEKQTITLDGVQYVLDQFSPAVKQAVNVYNSISADLQKAQIEVMKCQSAIQTISSQIGEAVKKELAEKAEPVNAEVTAEVTA